MSLNIHMYARTLNV